MKLLFYPITIYIYPKCKMKRPTSTVCAPEGRGPSWRDHLIEGGGLPSAWHWRSTEEPLGTLWCVGTEALIEGENWTSKLWRKITSGALSKVQM